MMTRKIEQIIIHCSDSKWGSAAEIRKWHLERAFDDIGYHFVISNGRIKPDLFITSIDGSVETGRLVETPGAHARGENQNSIGICLIGKSRFTDSQLHSLLALLDDLCGQYCINYKNIKGHYETQSGIKQGKSCPNFNVNFLREHLRGKHG